MVSSSIALKHRMFVKHVFTILEKKFLEIRRSATVLGPGMSWVQSVFMPPTTPQTWTPLCLCYLCSCVFLMCLYWMGIIGTYQCLIQLRKADTNCYKLSYSAICFTVIFNLGRVSNLFLNSLLWARILVQSFHKFEYLTMDSAVLWYPSYREHRQTQYRQSHADGRRRKKQRMSTGFFRPKITGFRQDFSGAFKIFNPKNKRMHQELVKL